MREGLIQTIIAWLGNLNNNILTIVMSVIGVMLGVIAGGFITWRVAKRYYQKSAEDLEKEANKLRDESTELRRLTILVLKAMENAGQAKLNRDEKGKIKGIVLSLKGTISPEVEANATLTVHNALDKKE